MTLADLPALRSTLCAFHGQVLAADVQVPVTWQARFRIAEQICAQLQNPSWFATVQRPSDLEALTASTGHLKCLASVLFEWEPL